MNANKESHNYFALVSEDTADRIDRLSNVVLLMKDLLDAKKEYEGGETNLPAKELESFFSLVFDEVQATQNELCNVGGVFSVSEVINGLRLVRESRNDKGGA